MPVIEPIELTRAAGRLTEVVFSHEYGKVPWLLVQLTGTNDELSAALRAADTNEMGGPPSGPIAFRTEIVSETPIRLGREGAVVTDRTDLVKSLGDERYFAVPIRKRVDVDAVFGERISIGRALNKDICLRHASISKFHAYFQLGGTTQCALADAGSKNGTTVNGTRIPPKEVVEVVSGDRVGFGSVSTIVLDARTLHHVLRTR
jgi:hypothetical protein